MGLARLTCRERCGSVGASCGPGFYAGRAACQSRVARTCGERGYTFRVRTCIDLRGIQIRVRMCGGPRPLAIQIRTPNVYQPARDTDSGANVWRVGRAARSASVSRLYFRQHSNRGHGLGSCEACKWIPVLLRVSNQNCAQMRAPRYRWRCAVRLPSPLDGPACPRRSQGSRSQGGGYETHKTHWHVWASSARPHFGGGVVAGHGGVDGAAGDVVGDEALARAER